MGTSFSTATGRYTQVPGTGHDECSGIYRQLVEEDRGQACSLLELCHIVLLRREHWREGLYFLLKPVVEGRRNYVVSIPLFSAHFLAHLDGVR